MSDVIRFLRRFNRKERFLLLGHVLDQQSQESFRLNKGFIKELGKLFQLEIPDDAFVAMDYHLDWIQMALFLADERRVHSRGVIPNPDHSLIRANQEDVDLLIAFDERQLVHMILIEVKADTGWSTKQLNSKANRLNQIFEQKVPQVVPHFLLMSPQQPPKSGSIGQIG